MQDERIYPEALADTLDGEVLASIKSSQDSGWIMQ